MARTWVLRSERERANLDRALDEAMEEKALYRVELKRYRRKRSSEQNNTIHMWFTEIAEFTGYTQVEIKDEMKKRFGPPPRRVPFLGEFRYIMKSTADYDVKEMTEFMERIQQWCAEWDIPITDPDPSIHHPVRV